MNSADDNMTLLAHAAKLALELDFDIGSSEGLEQLREFARGLAAHPDAPDTERVLEVMIDLKATHGPGLKVTKGVAPPVIQLNIPDAQRVLKKGRGYFRGSNHDLNLGG
ncbi:hypothetical protein [Pseudomonas viridiflava]|uniref:hypothetical protein n=1 Tax=Pseudomonas TaxID=286 RepID=UPI002EACFFBD|nr:hypothetical protein [Pseudomonas viridiflava]